MIPKESCLLIWFICSDVNLLSDGPLPKINIVSDDLYVASSELVRFLIFIFLVLYKDNKAL